MKMLRVVAAFSVLSASATSCADVTATADPATLAGTYALETTAGRYAPTAGSFVLTSDGRAERHVRYSTSEHVAAGTFTLGQNGDIIFALNESCGTATCVWTVRAVRIGNTFTLEYPDPADGPNIQETYFRR